MAANSQTFDLSSATISKSGARILSWTGTVRAYPQIIDALRPAGTTRYLTTAGLFSLSNLAIVSLFISDSNSGGAGSNEDLTDAFENSGYLTFSFGDNYLEIPIGGQDTEEPYQYRNFSAAKLKDIYDFTGALNNPLTGLTMTIWDGQPIQRYDLNPTFPISNTIGAFTPEIQKEQNLDPAFPTARVRGSYQSAIDHIKPLVIKAVDPVFPAGQTSGGFVPKIGRDQALNPDFPTGQITAEFTPDFKSNLTSESPNIAWLAEIDGLLDDRTHRVWSGFGDLIFDGRTWLGTQTRDGPLVAISPITNNVGEPSKRAQVSIAVPTAAIREMLAIDVGPVEVSIQTIYSVNSGRSWIRLPTGFKGFLSRPQFNAEGSIYTVELETWSGDADRGDPRYWSDEHQRQRYPGDKGFEFMRANAEGLEIRWPP